MQLNDSLATKLYLTYIVLGGDVEKTATACEVDPKLVQDCAERENWRDRLESTARLTSEGRGPAEIERLLNRATTYVQAMRIRRVIDVVLNELEQRMVSNKTSVLEAFTHIDKEGNKRIDLKPLAELATAAHKLSSVAFSAMSDSAGERVKRWEAHKDRQDDAIALGAKVLKGLSNIPAVAGRSDLVAIESLRTAVDEE